MAGKDNSIAGKDGEPCKAVFECPYVGIRAVRPAHTVSEEGIP